MDKKQIFSYISEQIGINNPNYPIEYNGKKYIDEGDFLGSLYSFLSYIVDNKDTLFDGVTVPAYFDAKQKAAAQERINELQNIISNAQVELATLTQ